MTDFKKLLHFASKKKLFYLLINFMKDIEADGNNFVKDPEIWIKEWIDKNCLPVSDYFKEVAINEMSEWGK